MDPSEIVESFIPFLPENYSIIPRKNQQDEIYYWAIRYFEGVELKPSVFVVLGTMKVYQDKLFVYLRPLNTPFSIKVAERFKEAYEQFIEKFSDCTGCCQIN